MTRRELKVEVIGQVNAVGPTSIEDSFFLVAYTPLLTDCEGDVRLDLACPCTRVHVGPLLLLLSNARVGDRLLQTQHCIGDE